MFSEFIYKKQVQLFLAILNSIECGSLHLTLPDGCTHIFKAENAGPDADLRLHTRSALSRILRDGKMGFCEAIMDGDASSKALPNLIELAVYHDEDMDLQLKPNFIRKWALRAYHHWRRNSKSGSAKNISHHYDLGNDFYAHWLDPTMTYSSPYAIAASRIVSGTPRNPKTVSLTTGVPPKIIVIITAATFPVPKNAITGIINTKAGIVCIKSIIGLINE